MSFDIYTIVTDHIIESLEKGTVPWHKPWHGGCSLAISHVTGKPYSLLNQLLLGAHPGEYITYKQCALEGGHVRKGEKSRFVVFWKLFEVKDDDNPDETKKVPFLLYHNVFHISQCEGIKPKYSETVAPLSAAEVNEAADKVITDYVARSGVKLEHVEGDEAYYSPSLDKVVLPEPHQFENTAEYYSTAFHELTHSTGHVTRLNRLDQAAHFGNEVYSREELVAEIGAATLVNHVGLETESSFKNSVSYIAGWLKALKDDRKMIVVAAGKAEKAVNLILGKTEEEDKEDE